ncbi:MAG: class I SAM-dependent methyltransferase [Desulfovermiculus sp.]|nr:class I SAM-dependent methyltransferase [Desulfovermiculus sp.]
MPLDHLHTLSNNIKGFLARDEAEALYDIGRQCARLGPCLEIGSYCGLSTLYLGSGVKASGGVLFSIDHHQGSEEHQPGEEFHDPDLYDSRLETMNSFPAFQHTLRLADLENTVVPIVAQSALTAKAWATPLSLVFIDGGHSLESALVDYHSWATWVCPGGILAIHDIFPDPSQGGQAPYQIYNLALASGLFQELPMINTLGRLQRRSSSN